MAVVGVEVDVGTDVTAGVDVGAGVVAGAGVASPSCADVLDSAGRAFWTDVVCPLGEVVKISGA